MLYAFAIILMLLWLLGLVTKITLSGLIHVFLVLGIILILARIISGGRKETH